MLPFDSLSVNQAGRMIDFRLMRNIFLTVAVLAASVPAFAQPTAFVGGRVIDGSGRVIEASRPLGSVR